MWEDLSFKDRSKLIELGASQGILDLSTIKHLYNINADGGYLKWKKEIAKHKGIDIDNDKTYNYQAFFEEDPQRAWDMLKKDSEAHFTDKYKTVWHPTFSDESVYSGHKSKYNPQGLVGGHWEGNTFRMSDSLYNSPVSMDERQQYLIDNEHNGVSLLESDGTLPVYDGIPWGGVLPEVTITPQYSDGGSIHIAKNKRGTFKAQASRMGMSTQQAASHILANKDDYSPAMVKKAVFAHNFAHADGGPLDNTILHGIKDNYNGTVNSYIDGIYANGTEESYGNPSDHYNNVNEEKLKHMTPNARGHYDDSVKLPNHPSSPTRGTFNGQYFDFTDKGFEDPNYTMFGLQDNGDGNAIMRYNGAIVIPELTVTPNGNYYNDTYNNIKIHQGHKHDLE